MLIVSYFLTSSLNLLIWERLFTLGCVDSWQTVSGYLIVWFSPAGLNVLMRANIVCLCVCVYMYIFEIIRKLTSLTPFLFFLPAPPMHTHPRCLSNSLPLFLWSLLHIYTYTLKHMSPTCSDHIMSLLYVYVFRADYLVLDNQLVWSFLGKLLLPLSLFLSCP